jgi:nitroreductase
MNLNEALNWRYAVKKYSDKIVTKEKLDQILEAINLSASSVGIQPYRLVVVEDKEIQARLGEGSFNSQIKEASHLLVFAAFENITQEHISAYIDRVIAVRKVPAESMDYFKQVLENNLLSRSTEENFNWSARQAYIALGTALIAAAVAEVDATPMEGFDAGRFDEILGLKEKGLKSVVVLSIGYRDEEKDEFSKMKKVRLPIDEFVLS